MENKQFYIYIEKDENYGYIYTHKDIMYNNLKSIEVKDEIFHSDIESFIVNKNSILEITIEEYNVLKALTFKSLSNQKNEEMLYKEQEKIINKYL